MVDEMMERSASTFQYPAQGEIGTEVHALHSRGTILKIGENQNPQDMLPIKSIGALGSEPNKVEVTTLDIRDFKRYIDGLQDLQSIPLVANYTKDHYKGLEQYANKDLYVEIWIGTDSTNQNAQGKFKFKAKMGYWLNEVSVDAPLEIGISLTPISSIEFDDN